mgnify:CR=1 FL=1
MPVNEGVAQADIDLLKVVKADDGLWRGVMLVLTRLHAEYVAKAESGDADAIQRARGVSAAMIALESARTNGAGKAKKGGAK